MFENRELLKIWLSHKRPQRINTGKHLEKQLFEIKNITTLI